MSQLQHKISQFVTLSQFKSWLGTSDDVEKVHTQSYIFALETSNFGPIITDTFLPQITEKSTMEEKLMHIKVHYMHGILQDLISSAIDNLIDNGYHVLYPWDVHISYDYKKTFDQIALSSDIDDCCDSIENDDCIQKLPITISDLRGNDHPDHQLDATFQYLQGLVLGFKIFDINVNICIFGHNLDFTDLPRETRRGTRRVLGHRPDAPSLFSHPELTLTIADKNYSFNSIMELAEFHAGLNFAQSLS